MSSVLRPPRRRTKSLHEPARPYTRPVAVPTNTLPASITAAGERASIRFLEFFASTIRNPHTRRAYARAVADFLAWCQDHGVPSITAVQPLHVAVWIEGQTQTHAAPTVKQHLAALRHLFDWLVTGQIIPVNPAASVRGPSHVVRQGKTPVLEPAEARALIDSIDVSTHSGLRDRALIAMMVYSFARVGAALGRGTAQLTRTPLPQANAYEMIRRRALAAGIGTKVGNHSFRATGITAYLKNGGTLEKAAQMANHASTRTTQLYDRRRDEMSLDEVERIRV